MNDVMKHRGEILRALASHKYETMDNGGVYIPSMGAVGGVYDVQHRRNGELLSHDISSNIIVAEGLTHLLGVAVAGVTQVNPWYVALFEGNVTPAGSLTAATFTATTTECTAYDEAARVAYVEGTVAAGAVDNAASRAVFTMNATKTIYGGALLSVSTKSSTSGVLLSAARFPSARAVVDDDELSVKFSLALTSA